MNVYPVVRKQFSFAKNAKHTGAKNAMTFNWHKHPKRKWHEVQV